MNKQEREWRKDFIKTKNELYIPPDSSEKLYQKIKVRIRFWFETMRTFIVGRNIKDVSAEQH
jgi:hypothetical protein